MYSRSNPLNFTYTGLDMVRKDSAIFTFWTILCIGFSYRVTDMFESMYLSYVVPVLDYARS